MRDMSDETEQVRHLRRQVTHLREVLERKNRQLDALHFVWCSGGCDGGTHRYGDGRITKELVEEAVRNTYRLIAWFGNNEFKHAFPAVKDRFEYIARFRSAWQYIPLEECRDLGWFEASE